MKRIIFSITFTGFFLVLYSQIPIQPIFILNPEEDTIGKSIYDLQTNALVRPIFIFMMMALSAPSGREEWKKQQHLKTAVQV